MEASDRAAVLIRQLLAFGRNTPLKKQPLDLNIVIANLAQILRRLLGVNIELVFEPENDLFSIDADPVQIEQVIMNLCINARDAFADQGTIVIRTENRRNAPIPPGGPDRPTYADYVRLSIVDNGRGIPAEIRQRIFEPFFTTKEIGHGSGLGLAIVYGIVKQHNGSIDVVSAPGKGSTFVIDWPATEKIHPAESSRVRQDRLDLTGSGERILVAEDNDLVRNLVIEVLTGAGYTVVPAVDGEEAAAAFDADPDRFDLALLDIVMPRMGGRTLARHIANARPHLPIIFSSGFAPSVDDRSAIARQEWILEKPYLPDDLLRAIRSALQHRVRH
jgi:CheY-like chemotaxis protein